MCSTTAPVDTNQSRPANNQSPHVPQRWPRSLIVLLAIASISATWSLTDVKELDIWAFELIPSVIGLAGFTVIARTRFTFSAFVHGVLAIAFVMVALGAHYTYAEMPIFDWIKEQTASTRNHFDRVGHGMQGFAVGLLAREVLIRTTTVGRSVGVPLLAITFSLAFSAFYEIVEWWTVILFYPSVGPDWLGLQGDPWDTQSDMLMALGGAILATLGCRPWHDRSINRRLSPTF